MGTSVQINKLAVMLYFVFDSNRNYIIQLIILGKIHMYK